LKFKKEFIIGITVVTAIALLLFGIQFLKGINFFNTNRTFYTTYGNVQELVPGSIIKFRGKQIGVVQSVVLNEKQDRLITTLSIDEADLKIPRDSKARLASSFLGTSTIEIVLGEDYENLLVQGDTIEPDFKYGISELATQKIDPIEKQVNTLLERLNKSLASVDTVLGTDGENLRKMMYSLRETVSTLNSTVTDVDNVVKASAADIKSTLANVALITQNLKNSNAKVTNLIANFSDISDSLKAVDIAGTVAETKAALSEVTKMMEQINNGDGSAHQLIYSNELVNNMNSMLAETQSLVNNIKTHPKRYLQFAVFGGKDKGLKLDATDERKLQEILDKQP
jgi:phospholipid/cholesterol/gamma-HCH transport system substrate-binding protein